MPSSARKKKIVILLGLRTIPRLLATAGSRHFDFSVATSMSGGWLALAFGIVHTNYAVLGSPELPIPTLFPYTTLFRSRSDDPPLVFDVEHHRLARESAVRDHGIDEDRR